MDSGRQGSSHGSEALLFAVGPVESPQMLGPGPPYAAIVGQCAGRTTVRLHDLPTEGLVSVQDLLARMRQQRLRKGHLRSKLDAAQVQVEALLAYKTNVATLRRRLHFVPSAELLKPSFGPSEHHPKALKPPKSGFQSRPKSPSNARRVRHLMF